MKRLIAATLMQQQVASPKTAKIMAERWRAGVRTVLGEIRINFPDARLTTMNSVAEGEWVVVRCTYGGTHLGASVDGGMLVGVQSTGRTFEVQHIHMYRVLDGKIAEHCES